VNADVASWHADVSASAVMPPLMTMTMKTIPTTVILLTL